MDTANTLLRIAQAYADATGKSLRWLGKEIVGSHRFFLRLQAGDGCSTGNLDKSMAYFDEKWPADLAWPAGIARGVSIIRSDAA